MTVRGDDVLLAPAAAQTLALAVHELTTNAAKYGALCSAEGRVDIDWELAGTPPERRLTLRWREAGGPAVTAPSKRGFGAWMIEEAVRYNLEGDVSLDFAPEGVRCTMSFVLPELSPPPGGTD